MACTQIDSRGDRALTARSRLWCRRWWRRAHVHARAQSAAAHAHHDLSDICPPEQLARVVRRGAGSAPGRAQADLLRLTAAGLTLG